MTVSTAPTPLTYNGDGSTTAFPITWKYNAISHVVAILRSSAGVETVWALTTNYTLTAPGNSGTLTAVVAPATGEKLVITLEPPNTQSSDLPLGGDLPSTTLEDGFDLSAQRDAKIESLFLRALRVPKTDTQTGSLLELPIDSSRASKFLSFDANGKPIAAAGTSANLGPVSAFINTLLDDADAATAQRTLSPGVAALTANTTLGASHYGQFIQVSGAAVTLTLSDAATLTAGWNCWIVNTDSTNAITIARATAGDTINGSAANFTFPALHAIRVFVIAAANGFLIRSSTINPATTDTAQTITGEKTFESTDAGAGVGPTLILYRNSASPAASDLTGRVSFTGEDSAGNSRRYAQILARIDDPTTTSEDGSLVFRQVRAGAEDTDTAILGQGLQVGAPTGGDKGAGTINTAGQIYINNVQVVTNWANFTPTVTLVGGAGNVVPVYSINSARFARNSNVVYVLVNLNGDGGAEGAGTGQINIALPVTANASAIGGSHVIGRSLNGVGSTILISAVAGGATTIALSSQSGNLTGDDQNNTTRSISLMFFYEA